MRTDDKLKEECAVFGVSTSLNEAAGITYNALLSLQHRGQEGTGIAVVSHDGISCYKNRGLVSEVFTLEKLAAMPKSAVGIGHNRYSTTGNNTAVNVQPFVTEYLTGRIATVHNGNVTNAGDIREGLRNLGVHFEASSDSEVVSSLIGYYAVKLDDVYKGAVKAAQKLEGAFSLIILTGDESLIAIRDPNGYRPLCIGENKDGIAVSSESCGLDTGGFDFVRDIEPGEAVVIKNGRLVKSEIVLSPTDKCGGLCVFEYVYFARPDSVIDGLSVYEARFNMGRMLAKEHPVEADAVCGVPDSGLIAAAGYSAESGIPLVTGFVKNPYVGRSFIYPTQAQRESAVKLKLNPLKVNVSGKRIVLVDDSIVRGTTSEKIVKTLKDAGASEVHMRISSPPFKFTCNYGTDVDNEENLIANKLSVAEIGSAIGTESLGYISIKGLKTACCKSRRDFCTKCFTGNFKSHKKNFLEE